MEIELIVAVSILFALVFLATIDMAFSQLSDVALRRLVSDLEADERRASSAEFLRSILENRPRFRFALSSAIQVLLIVFSVLVTIIVYNFYREKFTLLFVSLAVGLIASIIFRQFIPRFITWRNPENKLLVLLPAARPLYGLLSNVADPFQLFTKDNSKENPLIENTIVPNQQQPLTEAEREDAAEDIQALIEMGEAEGIIEEEERELIETMVEFGETRAGEIMTPRTEICALPLTATVKQARDLIIEEKYSRLPVYRDSIDNIEGVIYVRDLLNVWAENGRENQTIESLLRPAFFVPETKSAHEVLKNMQSGHYQVAFVVDEYGGVAGLITVEDILEEIVGEIEDEDTEEEEVIEIIEGGDGYFDVLGSTEIEKIERALDLEIEADGDDFTTVAGMVTSEAGRVPKRGEKLIVRGLEVQILKADDKRLNLLRLRRHEQQEAENDLEATA
jgi:putative hemolysin